MKKTAWFLAGALLLALTVAAVACGGAPAEEKAPTPTPAPAPATPAPTPKPTPAPTTPAPTTPTTPAATPPKAPKAVHEALFAATPPGCTVCHTVGAAGVGAAGGPGLPASHTGRTSDMCKGCHQLSN